jgi:hypothetical protein
MISLSSSQILNEVQMNLANLQVDKLIIKISYDL